MNLKILIIRNISYPKNVLENGLLSWNIVRIRIILRVKMLVNTDPDPTSTFLINLNATYDLKRLVEPHFCFLKMLLIDLNCIYLILKGKGITTALSQYCVCHNIVYEYSTN